MFVYFNSSTMGVTSGSVTAHPAGTYMVALNKFSM